MIPALSLAFVSGFIALSYEILWYRAYSFTTGGAASTFGLLLGAYLLGLSLGSLGVRALCRDGDREQVRQLKWLFRLSLAATLCSYLVVPLLGLLAVRGRSGTGSMLLVTVAAAGLGTVFPLMSHLGVAPDERAGRRISYVYLANILGSTLGSLITGLVLMDRFSLGQLHVLLLFLGIAVSAFILVLGVRSAGGAAALVVSGVLAVIGGGAPFVEIYEKLQGKVEYRPGRRFAHVVETRSGVITVNEAGQVFGGGIYDGAFNTDLRDDKNSILRCYALAGLRESTKDVLMIGLSSGSWATVVANNPTVERLTIVEINPGYLELIPKYSAVAGLLSNPKVRIEIDDGRRWLVRNKERRFDAIVANATFHWRSNASNLLSEEFLMLIRSRLKEGGYYYYNTTESARVLKTGCRVFRHALKIGGFLAVSDAPLTLDPDRLREKLFEYPRAGGTALDRTRREDVTTMEEALLRLQGMLRRREEVLALPPGGQLPVTDDNMGTEWGEGP